MRLDKAVFNGVDYANNTSVEIDLLENEFGDPYIPRIGEFFLTGDLMYKITHVYWNREKGEVRVKGHATVLCYVLTPFKSPVFEGSVDQTREWLKANPIPFGSVYLEAPYNEAVRIDTFMEMAE